MTSVRPVKTVTLCVQTQNVFRHLTNSAKVDCFQERVHEGTIQTVAYKNVLNSVEREKKRGGMDLSPAQVTS